MCIGVYTTDLVLPPQILAEHLILLQMCLSLFISNIFTVINMASMLLLKIEEKLMAKYLLLF